MNGTLARMYSSGYNMDLEQDLMAPHTDCANVSIEYYCSSRRTMHLATRMN
ncbi:MAG: hypothetical protein H6Q30_1599 [Bacteroidetes bacterium]|nr:hypothetical protein [Bacteroidota bacterium]